jgi:hypothetical protein
MSTQISITPNFSGTAFVTVQASTRLRIAQSFLLRGPGITGMLSGSAPAIGWPSNVEQPASTRVGAVCFHQVLQVSVSANTPVTWTLNLLSEVGEFLASESISVVNSGTMATASYVDPATQDDMVVTIAVSQSDPKLATTTLIEVTYVDNELLLIASTGSGSSTLAHIKTNGTCDFSIIPQEVLPRGGYQLHCVGLNWGGPAQFIVTLTTNGVKQAPITYSGTDDWCKGGITISV